MYKTGALITNSRLLVPAVAAAAKMVSEVLYIPLLSLPAASGPGETIPAELQRGQGQGGVLSSLESTCRSVRQVYFHASEHNPNLDIRFLLNSLHDASSDDVHVHVVDVGPGPSSTTSSINPQQTRGIPLVHSTIDVLLSTYPSTRHTVESMEYAALAKRAHLPSLNAALKNSHNNDSTNSSEDGRSPSTVVHLSGLTPHDTDETVGALEMEEERKGKEGEGSRCRHACAHTHTVPVQAPFLDTVLGGTFDTIHNGHRLLLTESALLATRRVVVGVTHDSLLGSKVLSDLIRPVERRVAQVEAFLADVCPHLSRRVVPIEDIYGPTAWDGELECLVVSPETLRGGEKVNEERKKKVTLSCSVI